MSSELGIFTLGCVFGICFTCMVDSASYKYYGAVPVAATIVGTGFIIVGTSLLS